MFRWADASAFWFLVPLVLAYVSWIFFQSRNERRLSLFASFAVLPKILIGYSPKKKKRKFTLLVVALVFAVLALARPQMGTHEESMPSEGLDLVFVLDVSNSMLTEDIVPNRLKKAKHIIRRFTEKLSGDRIGVVAFAGSAYPAVPLTTDYDFALQALETLDEHSISNQGTNFAAGLDVALNLIRRGSAKDEHEKAEEQNKGSQVMVVLSDGEDHEGEEKEFLGTLKKAGVTVFSIGVGSLRGGPIPIRSNDGYMQGFKRDSSGGMVHTKLEQKALEAIASKTGGKFYMASSDEGEVEDILSSLSSFSRAEGQGRRVTVYDELFQYPLALAILFFLVSLGMTEFAVAACFLVLSTNAMATESVQEYSETKKGLQEYQDQDFKGAVESFGKAQAADPDSEAGHLNLGDALFKAGNGEAAIPEFKALTNSDDANTAARGSYNLGRALSELGKSDEALSAYQKGLDKLIGNPKADPEIVQRLKRALEMTQQQKDKGEDQKKDKKEDQSKDQNKNNQDQKDDKNQSKQYQAPKPRFKEEKLNESDAKRILKQLQEQEKKTQQQLMRSKTGKPEDDKKGKDW